MDSIFTPSFILKRTCRLVRFEQKWGEVAYVIAPDKPRVKARSFDGGDRHVLRLEPGNESAIRTHQSVFGSAGDPEKTKVGRLGVECAYLPVEVELLHCGTEAADPSESVGVSEADGEAFKSAHRKPGDGVILATPRDLVSGFHLGDHFGEQGAGGETGVMVDAGWFAPHICGAMDKGHIAVGEWHDDNHGLDLALGEKVVEDCVHPPIVKPAQGGVGPSVEKIEDRVEVSRFRIVAGRRIDVVVALVIGEAEDRGRGVAMVVGSAMRDPGLFPQLGGCAGDGNHAGRIDEAVRDAGIGRVEAWQAIDFKVITIDLGCERTRGDRPYAGVILRHRRRLRSTFKIEQDRRGGDVPIKKGDGAICVDLGGWEVRQNLSARVGRANGHEESQGCAGFARLDT